MRTLTVTTLALLIPFSGLAAQHPDDRSPIASVPAGATELAMATLADGSVVAESSRFQARFAAGTAAVEVPRRAHGAGALPRLELRFVGAERGGVAMPCDVAAPAREGDAVAYHHEGVVERYHADARGVEQTFEFAQRPQGDGDLVLQVAVGGNVAAPPCQAAHRALEFEHEGVRSIRYGEAVAFDRGGLRTEVRTRYDGAGLIELIVPCAFVDRASYPMTVDPAIGSVFTVDDPSWNDVDPDVAYDLASDRNLVVWRRIFSASSAGIRCQLFDSDGASITGYVQVASTPTADAPAVAACNAVDPDAFLVVFVDNGAIWGRLVSTATGLPLAPAFPISQPTGGAVDDAPTVSGPGDGAMMVAWQRTFSGETEARGVRMCEIYFPTPASLTPSISPERDVQTLTSGHVRNVRIAASDVSVDVGGTTWFANRLVWDRWWTSPAPGDWDIYTCSVRVNPNGFGFQFVDSVSALSFANAIGDNELSCAIAGRAELHQTGDGLQYCVAWEDERDVHAVMLDLDGVIGTEIVVDDSPDFDGMPAVGAGFCEFTIAYGVIVPPAEFSVAIYGARVLLDGTVAVNRRLIDDPGGPYQAGVMASSRPIATTTDDPHNRSLLAWWGQTGTGTGLNDVRMRFFEPVAPSITPYGNLCPGPLGEAPMIGVTGGAPYAGNEQFAFTVSGAPANTIAVLLIGDTLTTVPVPGAPGCELYMGLPLLNALPVLTDGSGFAQAGVPMPCSIPNGVTLAFQWGLYTPGWNAFGWITSADLDVRWTHF